MTRFVTLTLEEIGLKTTVDFGEEVGNWGYSHKDVVKAFKAKGLTPITKVEDLYQVVFHATNTYIPDQAFFEVDVPDCPYKDGNEFVRDEYLADHGGWAPGSKWVLVKE
jgi:hypothetical protein